MVEISEMVDNVCNIIFLNVPDCFRIHEMCDKAVEKNPNIIKYIPTRFKTQKNV